MISFFEYYEYNVDAKVSDVAIVTEEHKGKSFGMFDEYEMYLLAKIAMAEAEGESIEGKALVMNVVLNRVESSAFPDTIEEVIFQQNQFTPIIDGRFDRVAPNGECWQALEMVQAGYDISNDALYFSSDMSEDNWHNRNLDYILTYGNHKFYK